MTNLLHRSPGITAIFNELTGTPNKRVIDLGPMRASTFNFFSSLKTNIHFENLNEFLEEHGSLSTDNLVFQLKQFLLSQHGREKFNAILAWDFFNYLPPEGLKTILEILQPFCTENAILHLLSYTSKNIPREPRTFSIKDQYFIEFNNTDTQARRLPAVDTAKLLKNTPNFVMQQSFMNKEGMQSGITEYMLRFSKNTSFNVKRAVSKVELSETLSSGNHLPLHTSPALAYAFDFSERFPEKCEAPTLLDLGPTNHHNESVLAKRYNEVYTENILSLLQNRQQQKQSNDGTEFGLGLFNFDLALRFDQVFLWDIVNFLDARQLNELLVRLRPFIHQQSLLFAILYSTSSAPEHSQLYKLQLENKLAISPTNLRVKSFNPHSAIEFTKCLPGLSVEKTWLFQEGMKPGLSEYVFSFQP